MKRKYEEQYIQFEKKNWWFIARRELIKNLLDKITNKNSKIIDIGSGSGINIQYLKNYNIVGVDKSKRLVQAGKKEGKNIRMYDVEKRIPFRKNSFDVALCLDILEHLENDDRVLKEIYRILTPKGKILITVPAFGFLWGQQDIVSMHKRRYTKRMLIKLVKENNFKIKRITYWNSFLFPIMSSIRILRKNKKNPQTDFKDYPKFINKILLRILRLENFIISKNINLPIGVSLIAILEKE